MAALPASILTIVSGVMFPKPPILIAFVIVSLASTIGATIAFFLARYALRDWAMAKVARFPKVNSTKMYV